MKDEKPDDSLETTAKLEIDRRFVHVTNVRKDGYVEFDFSVGDPELYVELILPQKDFREFCKANQVTELSEDQARKLNHDRKKWSEGGLD